MSAEASLVSTDVSNSCIPALTLPLSDTVVPVKVPRCVSPTVTPASPANSEDSSAASTAVSSCCITLWSDWLSVTIAPVKVPISVAEKEPLTVMLLLDTTVPEVPASSITLAVGENNFVEMLRVSAPLTLPVAPTGSRE